MLVLLTYLVRVVSSQEVIPFRQMMYRAIPGINNRELRTLFENVWLTLRLHPWSLLIESEEPGKISLGGKVSLTVYVVTNVLKAAEKHRNGGMDAVFESRFCHTKRLPKSHAFETPSKILTIKDPENTGIRAVIVIEHRNVGAQMEWMKDNMHRIVIVMVSHIILDT